VAHLFKLFEIKLSSIQPDLGIELFVLEAQNVEDHSPAQEKIWKEPGDLNDNHLSELLDRLTVRIGQPEYIVIYQMNITGRAIL
jgi:protein ImuB